MPALKTINLAIVLVVGMIAVSGLFAPNITQARTLAISQEIPQKSAAKQQVANDLFLKCLPILNLPIVLGIAIFLINKSKI